MNIFVYKSKILHNFFPDSCPFSFSPGIPDRHRRYQAFVYECLGFLMTPSAFPISTQWFSSDHSVTCQKVTLFTFNELWPFISAKLWGKAIWFRSAPSKTPLSGGGPGFLFYNGGDSRRIQYDIRVQELFFCSNLIHRKSRIMNVFNFRFPRNIPLPSVFGQLF